MKIFKLKILGAAILWGLTGLAYHADAQDVSELTSGEEVTITLDEAIQIALVNNHLLRKGLLDLDRAEAQIREAWGSVYPQINASGSYTRNLRTPNPFAGSDAGGLFESFGAVDWLAFNESARTDGDPNTNPISFDEYLDRQRQGYEDAGIAPPGSDGSNPFAVENQFEFGLSVTQAVYNGAAFSAIKAAKQFRELNQDQVQADRQQVVNEVKNSFYSALLAKEQVEVLRSSVERLRVTVEETRRSVEAGVLSRYDRVSAEVELVNLETNLIEAENQAELAAKNLALQLGIPTQNEINLRGALEYDESMQPEVADKDVAYEIAMQQRPDISQTENLLELRAIEGEVTKSRYFPTVNAFANFAYIGSVPSNRTLISPVEGQEFTFTTSDRGFFDDSYWNEAVSVGLRMNWSIFNGFQTRMQVQQNKIDIKKAEIDREFQQNAVYLEIDQTMKNLETSLRRIRSQERNLEQAELNYEFSLRRLQEGAGTALQERQASSLLDQSKLNYLSAVYDYLIALSQYEKSIGKPVLDAE
ncbi:TolC family protein [Rhodohalobacter barkolensis]|uniref:TolC family protein n=1 Tax=Rhodohalobacter barkolensis TaxID=2053187 RepID=A0A2N0VHD2_9BACT|nr:TolC family protein [Rhodohalobacter barkolensis]PKD43538.1 TolC family protein [Rhodohalobacter barkolensis]